MADLSKFYVDGAWVTPRASQSLELLNPATGEVFNRVALGNQDDVDHAVAAAKRAFPGFSLLPVAQRRELLEAIDAELVKRNDEIAAAISLEMGAPMGLAREAQAPSGTQHFGEMVRVLENFEFHERRGSTLVRREPIGVCALISPWNWPMNQLATKVAPALGAGCTMVVKPSELAPLDALILAEIMHDVGVPAGVFNLVNGTGQGVGDRLTSHPDIDMVSFTGSTRAGIAISRNAAPTIKRLALELGGKSAGIILDDFDLDATVSSAVAASMTNTGQSCNALTRLLIPRKAYTAVSNAIVAAVRELSIGMPEDSPDLGPVANRAQFERVAEHIEKGLEDGATLLEGGPGLPDGVTRGFFIRPTIFGDVTADMHIARQEIFGPVLSLMPYDTRDDAIAIANDSVYGLSGYVWGSDSAQALDVASAMRTGMVHLNGASLDASAPFGGYKMSGNGREWGEYGLEDFLEYKSVYGGAHA